MSIGRLLLREIGRLLGIPEGTARSDLHHARARLRQALSAVRSEL